MKPFWICFNQFFWPLQWRIQRQALIYNRLTIVFVIFNSENLDISDEAATLQPFRRPLGVNFINVKRTSSFYYIHVTRKKAAEMMFVRKIPAITVDEIDGMVNFISNYEQFFA